MEKRNFVLIIFLALSLMFTSYSVSFADPSGLVVVRASDNSLWKATCVGTTCTSFTSFPGMFGSQPTVYWDEDIQSYVLWGRAADGSIWRSTFNRLGTFNNDWASVPGSTASPPGAAGGGVVKNFSSNYTLNTDGQPCTTLVSNVKTQSIYAPLDGFALVTATGAFEFARGTGALSGDSWARIYLTQTSAGTASNWIFASVPAGTPLGDSDFPYAHSMWFFVSPGYETFYVTCEEGGSAAATTTTTIRATTLSMSFYPYSM